jgi:hypothetical protein
MARKLKVKFQKQAAITITRNALQADRLVYVATASKKLRYQFGKSSIVYIGTTKNGVHRIASSAASKAEPLLTAHGIRHLEFYVVTCSTQQAVKTWRKLERALLIRFRERFGVVPMGNKQGVNLRWKDELQYFTYLKLDKVIDYYS